MEINKYQSNAHLEEEKNENNKGGATSKPLNEEKEGNKKVDSNTVSIKADADNNKNNNCESESSKGCSKPLIILLIVVAAILVISLAVSLPIVFAVDDDDEDEDKKNLLIDADEGGDDMVAYTIANISGKYNILGLTIVNDQGYVDETTSKWLGFLSYMNFKTKVYKGSTSSMKRSHTPGTFSHNYGMYFPTTKIEAETTTAVDFIVETLENKEHVTVALIGPMTNFAKAIDKGANLDHVDKIVVMGGCKDYGCNEPHRDGVKQTAEYNIWEDPEAANKVFTCGRPVYLCGTDLTGRVAFQDDDYRKLLDINTKFATVIYNLLKGTHETWGDDTLHDPATIISLLNNDLITFKDYYAVARATYDSTKDDSLADDFGAIDFYEPSDEHPANIHYSTGFKIDRDAYFNYLFELAKKY